MELNLKILKIFILVCFIILGQQTASATVVINEILADQTGGAGAAVNDEFVELYNNGASSVDIGGWNLADGDPALAGTPGPDGINFVFPSPTLVPAGAYVVVWIGSAANPDNSAVGAAFEFWLESGAQMNNSGDDVRLYDNTTPTAVLQDYVAYGATTVSAHDAIANIAIWDPVNGTILDNTAKGRSISLTPNGIDANTSACWTRTTGSDASAACPDTLTVDTSPVVSGGNQRVASPGQDNNLVVTSADISVTKTDSSASYTPGANGTYTLVVSNAGPSGVVGMTVSDILPNGVSLNGGIGAVTCIPAGSAVCGTPSLTGQQVNVVIDIPNGDSVTINIPVTYSSNPVDY